ncbi:MAG: hypothetical protein KIT40_08925 [Nitrospira sp.]|nr:hypothetical protein [Nitrospira sp.]
MRLLNSKGTAVLGLIIGCFVSGQALPLIVWAGEPVLPAGSTQPGQIHGALAAEGTVDRFILDPRGEVEGLLLADGTHLYVTSRAADQLVSAFTPGNAVQVYGRLFAAERLVQADAVTNVTTGTTFHVPLRLDLPMQEQEHTLSMTEMSAAGTIRAFFYHPLKKNIQGMLLSDETQVRFPPDASPTLRRSFHLGDHVTIKGNGTTNRFGRAVEALAIGRNSGALIPLDASLQRLP